MQKLLRGSQQQAHMQTQAEQKMKAAVDASEVAKVANEALVQKAARTQALATSAHSQKRAWKARAERSEQCSSGRLEVLKDLKGRHSQARRSSTITPHIHTTF